MKDCWKHWLKSYLSCMNDCSDSKTNDNFFDITKDFMSYFDQFYIKTCFIQVWKIVKCKSLEVFLLVTCKSASINWPTKESCIAFVFKLQVKTSWMAPWRYSNYFVNRPMIRTVLNFLWDTSWTKFEGYRRINLTSYEDNRSY